MHFYQISYATEASQATFGRYTIFASISTNILPCSKFHKLPTKIADSLAIFEFFLFVVFVLFVKLSQP